jgi:hypothetical protein
MKDLGKIKTKHIFDLAMVLKNLDQEHLMIIVGI